MNIILNTGLEGTASQAARAVGEIATANRSGNNSINQYKGKIDQTSYRDAPLQGVNSDFGTPVVADVTFSSVTYTPNPSSINPHPKPITLPSLTLLAILVNVNFPRNIVKTTIQGRNETVKEYIGEGDAQITFSGVIVGKNGQYPKTDVNTLWQIIKAPVAIPISCAYLLQFGIYSIVFEDRTFGQDEGGYSYQSFSLNAISDTPQEIQTSLNV